MVTSPARVCERGKQLWGFFFSTALESLSTTVGTGGDICLVPAPNPAGTFRVQVRDRPLDPKLEVKLEIAESLY